MLLKDISVFSALTRNMEWLSARQKVLAQNIANSDTPGYQARDIEKLSFRDLVRNQGSETKGFRTHESHIRPAGGLQSGFKAQTTESSDKTPNENNVALEDEILKVNDARQSYDLAASLYRKHIQMLKMAVGGRGG
jgi:flagellar basal-body rod protein FlgB